MLQCLSSLFTCITRNYGSIITAQIWMKNFLWWIPFFISKICRVEAWCGIYLHGCIECYKLTCFSASRANLVCRINLSIFYYKTPRFDNFWASYCLNLWAKLELPEMLTFAQKRGDILGGFNFLVWALTRSTIIQYSITQTAYMHIWHLEYS